MKIHNTKNIDELLTELYLQCMTKPICVYAGWKDGKIISVPARSREDNWYNKNWNYSFLCSIDNNSDSERIRHIINGKLEEMTKPEVPIPTSMRNLPIEWSED